MSETLAYYEKNAVELSNRYEAARLDRLYRDLFDYFFDKSSLLEIGCGSGRDAARMLRQNFGVFAIDGCKSLLDQAKKLHPELKDRLGLLRLPAVLPFENESFDGFYSIACLMHFTTSQISEIVSEVFRVLKPRGRGVVSVPVRRSDIDNRGIDDKGRVFNLLETEEWLKLFERCGFLAFAGEEQPDGANRDGITWISYFLEKMK